MEENLKVDTSQEPAAPQLSPVEQQAMEMGWKPKEEFDPDSGKEWIPADEFVRRKPFFDKIEVLNREIKTLKNGMEAFKQHHDKVKETEYKRALEDLKRQRVQAIEEQDAVKAFEVSDKIRELEDEAKQAVAQPQTGTAHVEFQSWLTDNQWYASDDELREFADALGIMYSKKMTPSEVLVKVSGEVRKKYPEKFRNPNKDRASQVDTKANGTQTRGTGREYQLTEMEKQIMSKIVRSGVMTKEEYIKELRRTKGDSND
jgi:hypothetical protein